MITVANRIYVAPEYQGQGTHNLKVGACAS